jgi:L-alanine-DL-glutamate epimerase-like enolase superfamily enzyme
LVENHDIDFVRSTLPNIGGITELMKALAICETHAVGVIPHFTGPIATAGLVNCLSTFSGPVLMEYNYGGRPIDYLPECLDFKNGKAYTNQRPGPRRHRRHEAAHTNSAKSPNPAARISTVGRKGR